MERSVIGLAYLGSRCTKFHASGCTCWMITSFIWNPVLAWCDFAMDPPKEQHQMLCRSRKSATETLSMIRQAFGEESMSCVRKVQTHRDRKRRDRWRAKSRACPSFSLESTGLFTKCQTVNSAYYCDVLRRLRENVRRLRPEIDNRPGCCITTTHRLKLPFSPGNFILETTWLLSPTRFTFLYFLDWR
jgi:hypothetical protein